MNRIFVYGTLKRGQRNAHYMRDAQYVGRHVTEKIYSMYEFGGYPAVCRDGRHAISGEVYRVNDRHFGILDEFESYPDFYQRIEIPTLWGDAWMYVVEYELCSGKRKLFGNWPK